jgi:hypothetical protein
MVRWHKVLESPVLWAALIAAAGNIVVALLGK